MHCLPTSSVNAMGFVVLITTPALFPLSLDLPCLPLNCPSHPPGSPLLVDCYFYALLPSLHLLPLPLPPSGPSVIHRVQPSYQRWLIVIFKGGLLSSHCRVSPPVSLMGWALSCSSPPPSSPSPLISLTCPSIAHPILLGHHCWLIMVLWTVR